MRLFELAINDFRVRKVNFGNHFTSLPGLLCQYRQFFEHGKLIHTILQDIQLFFSNSRAFISNNLSETLEGRLLEERHLLEEMRYIFEY